MISQSRFLISPTSHVAALLADDRTSVSILNDRDIADSIPVERFVQVYPDFSVVSLPGKEEAEAELERRAENAQCLDMVLFLFDADLPVDLRREVSGELQLLLESDDNKHYVLDIIFSRPLPKSADVGGARTASASNPRTRDLVSLIWRSQEYVQSIYDAWLVVEQEPLVRTLRRDEFLGSLIRFGIFRQLVTDAGNKGSLNTLLGSLVLNDQLIERYPTAPRILRKWFDRIGAQLPNGPAPRFPVKELPSYIEPDVIRGRQVARGLSADIARDAAVSQVERIADLFAKRKDQQAHSILDQVLSENVAAERGETHAVKTLCNVATKAAARGRKDITAECLARALRYPDGCDVVLYFQIGNEYRDLGRYNEAMQCYHRAEELAANNEESIEKIRKALIHIQTLRGEYAEALDQYRTIPDFRQKPSVLCSMADLFRNTGQLKEAKHYYDTCLSLASDEYRAVAGLAEVLKQKGKFHSAIRMYNKLLREFDIPDERSTIVYQLALSRLFRLVMQYDKAKGILLQMYSRLPFHPDVNLQLAIIYNIVGDVGNVAKHRDLARSGDSDRIRLSILEQVSPHLRGMAVVGQHGNTYRFDAAPMPEDVGLAKCLGAFFKITNSQTSEVVESLSGVRFVDRVVEDLSDVLKFHALTSNGLDAPPELQRRTYVLAKRGDRSLRNAISAIRCGEFLGAQRFEAELLLRAA